MSTQTMTHDTEGDRKKRCPLYGCKRVYSDIVALESHIKDHEIPAESIPGKILLCSSIGCSDSFPDMQQLMQHMRHHHKPNIFYLCESCRAKLRSYRGLLSHLHTCSKVSRAKLKTVQMQVTEGPSGCPHSASETWSSEQAPPLDDTATGNNQDFPHSQHVDNALAGPPLLDQSSNPVMVSREPLSFQQLNLEPLQLQTPDFGASSFTSKDGVMAPGDPLQFDGQAEHQGQAQAQLQPQGQFQDQPQPQGQFQAQPQPQGPPDNSRILLEHTRGRYKCVQCSLFFPNRKALTAHVHTEHKTSKEN